MLLWEYAETFHKDYDEVRDGVAYARLVEWNASRKARAIRDQQAQRKGKRR